MVSESTDRMSEAERAMSESGWMPIESAPKDGTRFLARFRGETIIAKRAAHFGEWVGINITWYDGGVSVTSLRDEMGNGGPTHWMPLPEPPEPRS